MSKFRPLAVAGVGALLVASLATVGMSSAFADTPTPTLTPTPVRTIPAPRPVPTPQTCTPVARPITFAPTVSPTVHPTVPPVITPLRCAPERFVVQLTQLGRLVVQNRVIASGPVSGTGSDRLVVATPTSDQFQLPGVFRRVNVVHTGISFPTINRALCVATVNQLGRWRFAGGPLGSIFRNSIGNGRYLLTGQWVFPTIRGVCSLNLIRGNPLLQNRIQPTYTNLQVFATGVARR